MSLRHQGRPKEPEKKDTRGYTMEIPNRGKGTGGMSREEPGDLEASMSFPPIHLFLFVMHELI